MPEPLYIPIYCIQILQFLDLSTATFVTALKITTKRNSYPVATTVKSGILIIFNTYALAPLQPCASFRAEYTMVPELWGLVDYPGLRAGIFLHIPSVDHLSPAITEIDSPAELVHCHSRQRPGEDKSLTAGVKRRKRHNRLHRYLQLSINTIV